MGKKGPWQCVVLEAGCSQQERAHFRPGNVLCIGMNLDSCPVHEEEESAGIDPTSSSSLEISSPALKDTN